MQELAWRVLTSPGLEDKLAPPERLVDAPAPSGALPELPARAPELGFGKGEPPGRDPARLLHRFANHELVAAELFAWAILHFHDAPPAFRLGLAHTLAEEQAHMRLYLGRLGALGHRFGEEPLSRYLWDALRGCEDPLQFVAGMALGFEQANLDFATETAGWMRAEGDAESAAVLERVVEDEVGHVRLGLSWFRRWKGPGSDWEEFRKALRPPMTPARAKGSHVEVDLRRKAGLDEDFILNLRVFNASRGRVPALRLYNPGVEALLGGRPLPRPALDLRHDLALLPTFLGPADDATLVPEAPDPAFLASLLDLGLSVGELRVGGEPTHPWSPSPELPGWDPAWRTVFAKPGALDSAEAVEAELGRLLAAGHPMVVLKAAYGSSGRDAQRVRASEGLLEKTRAWIRRSLPIAVQPWWPVKAEISFLFDAAGRLQGHGRTLADRSGHWLGNVVGPVFEGLSSHQVAALKALRPQLGAWVGPYGVDTLILESDPRDLRLEPTELNPRTTMGHLAHALRGAVAPGCAGVLALVPRDRPPDAPPTLKITDRPRIQAGVVALTDRRRARRWGAVLAVGPRIEAALALLSDPLEDRP